MPGQLTLELKLPPNLAELERDGKHVSIAGTVKLGGELPVAENLDLGDELHVKITDRDGQPVASGYLAVKGVALKPIEDKALGPLGVERIHSTKVIEG